MEMENETKMCIKCGAESKRSVLFPNVVWDCPKCGYWWESRPVMFMREAELLDDENYRKLFGPEAQDSEDDDERDEFMYHEDSKGKKTYF